MGMSIDYPSFEDIKRFSSFLNILMNPESFQKMSEDVKVTLEEMKSYVEAKAKLEDVDRYVSDSKATTQDLLDKAKAALEEQTSKEADFNDKVIKKETELAIKEESLNNLMTQTKSMAATVQQQKADVDLETAALTKRSEALDAKEFGLIQKEQDLAVKAAKLKDLLG